MADRTSARLFGEIFSYLAEEEGEIHVGALVCKLWVMMRKYDFHPCQMEDAQEALHKLDLVRRKVNPEYPDEWESVYRGEAGFFDLPLSKESQE